MSGLCFRDRSSRAGGPPPTPVPKDAPTKIPDTPQAKHVQAFIEAFNTRRRKEVPGGAGAAHVDRRAGETAAADRAKMFTRMKGDFGTLTVKRVAAEPAQDPGQSMPDKDGNEAIFSFDLEPKAPYKITAIAVDIPNVER